MEWLALLVAVLFSLLGLVCVFLVVLGLPGTWIMIALAAVIEWVDQWYLSTDPPRTFGLSILLICLVLAGIGEVLEFFAGMLGAKQAGSTGRGMAGALIGGLVGGILGVGIPIPVLGPLIGAIVGTFGGALVGELTHPEAKRLRESLGPATGATVGRVLGTLAKLPLALTVWVILCVAAFWL